MPTDHPAEFDLDRFLPYRINVLAHRLSVELAAVYEARFQIGIAEWRVLAHLASTPKVSIREIHARVNMDKAKVSRAAADLEVAGYLVKDINPQDRRLVSLRLTPKGRTLFSKIYPLAMEFEQNVLSRLTPDERIQLSDLISKLLDH